MLKENKNNCLVCGQHDFDLIYDHTLMCCRICGFITANMDIDEEILKNIYSENYFKGEEYLDYLKDKEGLQKNFRNRLKQIGKFYPNQNDSTVLEIGCAYGFFGEEFLKLYPNADYTGIDVVSEAITHARKELGLNAYCQDYLSFKTDKKFDHVFLWDVIEHLQHPGKFIDKIHSEQKPGGKLYITTGDIGTWLPRFQKKSWRLIHPPSHIHYFSKRSITKLLETKGYKVNSVKYPSVYRGIKLIFYSLFILNKKPFALVRWVYNKLPSELFIPLNTFDIMFLTATKR